MRALCSLLLAAAISFGWVANTQAKEIESYEYMDWKIMAREVDGKFLYCSMISTYDSGTTLYITLMRNYLWNMSFHNLSWDTQVKRGYPVSLEIDGEMSHHTGDGIYHGLYVPMPDDVELLRRVQDGNVMRLYSAGGSATFRLKNTKAGINELARCVQKHTHRASNSDGAQGSAAASRLTKPKNTDPEQLANWKAETVALTARILSAAPTPGYDLGTSSEAPKEWIDTYTIWATEEMAGSVTVLDTKVPVDKIKSEIVSGDAAGCKGKFISGTSPPSEETSGLVEIFSACSDKSTTNNNYTIFDRKAGGYYIIAVYHPNSLLDQTEEMKSKSNADIREASYRIITGK